jgi:ADP-ribose pyrophosphatase YjhB (NUDIX family)
MPSFVSASAVVVWGDLVLVVIDPIRDEPVLPGGHLKWDEDPRDAVVREVLEETGLTVEPVSLVGVYSGRQWAGEPGIVRIVYQAVVKSGHLESSPEGEAKWMALSDVVESRSRDVPLLEIFLRRHSTTSPA